MDVLASIVKESWRLGEKGTRQTKGSAADEIPKREPA